MKLCNQLQDTTEIDYEAAGKTLFASVQDGEIDLFFLDYILVLALDNKSILPLHNLLFYICRHNSNNVDTNANLLIYISRRLDSWTIPPISSGTVKALLTTLSEYMRRVKDNADKIIEARALLFFICSLCEAGHGSLFLTPDDSSKYRAEFRSTFAQFLSYLKASDGTESDHIISLIYSKHSFIIGDSVDVDQPSNDTENVAAVTPTANTDFVLSRAYRLMWLEHVMLCSGRIQSDSFMVELKPFLSRESNKDVIKGLVLTAFDCYAVSLLRKDSPKYQSLWKGFIVKRLPLVIKSLAGGDDSAENNLIPRIETVITQPLTMLDRGTVNLLRISGGGDELDEMFSSFPSTTSDIRHDFLQACVDLQLIDSECVKRTLGQEATSGMHESSTAHGQPGSDFVLDPISGFEAPIDDVFITAAQEDPEYVSFEESTIVRLISTYEELDGIRQEKVAKKILQVVHEWINSQMSRCLRRLCQALALKTNSLDMLLLHIQPIQLLVPLVRYLDNWKEDEDEINFQDTYTDFGSIFLLVMLIYRRYELGLVDLGFSPDNDHNSNKFSFIYNAAKNLQRAASWQIISIEDLSTDERDLLGGWITGLFDADGISDELMKSCTAKDLIKLAPLVFHQAINACTRNVIDFDALRGGLEYFVQPFMLSALVGAFRFLYTSLWSAQPQDSAVTIKVIHGLVLPPGISGEAMNLHQIVMSIAADDLMDALSEFQTNDTTTMSQITSGLTPYLSGKLTIVNQSATSLISAIKEHANNLVNWLQTLGQDPTQVTGPPGFNQSLIGLSVDILGSREIMNVFLDELDLAEAQGTFDYMLDVLSSAIVVMDTVPKDQKNYRPSRTRLDSCLLKLIIDETEDNIIRMRRSTAKTERPKEIEISSFRQLKKRVDALVEQTNSVPIWEKLDQVTEIPILSPLNDTNNNNGVNNDYNSSQLHLPDQDIIDSTLEEFGAPDDDYSAALLSGGGLGDDLFGDNMMMDLS